MNYQVLLPRASLQEVNLAAISVRGSLSTRHRQHAESLYDTNANANANTATSHGPSQGMPHVSPFPVLKRET